MPPEHDDTVPRTALSRRGAAAPPRAPTRTSQARELARRWRPDPGGSVTSSSTAARKLRRAAPVCSSLSSRERPPRRTRSRGSFLVHASRCSTGSVAATVESHGDRDARAPARVPHACRMSLRIRIDAHIASSGRERRMTRGPGMPEAGADVRDVRTPLAQKLAEPLGRSATKRRAGLEAPPAPRPTAAVGARRSFSSTVPANRTCLEDDPT